MVLCLPRSTHFPYTTLFRSYSEQISVREKPERVETHSAETLCFIVCDKSCETAVEQEAAKRHDERLQDRKSTRLNSSHSQISYAVFCLKKKRFQYRLSVVTL